MRRDHPAGVGAALSDCLPVGGPRSLAVPRAGPIRGEYAADHLLATLGVTARLHQSPTAQVSAAGGGERSVSVGIKCGRRAGGGGGESEHGDNGHGGI